MGQRELPINNPMKRRPSIVCLLALALAGAANCAHGHPAASARSGAPGQPPAPVSIAPNGPAPPPSPPAQQWAGTYQFTYTQDLPGVEHEIWNESGTAHFIYYQMAKGRRGYTFWYKGASQAHGNRHHTIHAGAACGTTQRSSSGATASTPAWLHIGVSSYSWNIIGWKGKFTASGKCVFPKSGTAQFGNFLEYQAPVPVGSVLCGDVSVTHKQAGVTRHLSGHWLFVPAGETAPAAAPHCAQIHKYPGV